MQPPVRTCSYLLLSVILATSFLSISIWTRANVPARSELLESMSSNKENSWARNERDWVVEKSIVVKHTDLLLKDPFSFI